MNRMQLFFGVLVLGVVVGATLPRLNADEVAWSVRAADAAMKRWPEGRVGAAGTPVSWSHDLAALLAGIEAVWVETSDKTYLNYIKASVDPLVGADGSIPTFKPGDYRLTNYQLGRQLLLLYRTTHDERYQKAAGFLYDQLAQHQPRSPSGEFWQSQNSPNQITPDGIDEAVVFYAEYAHDFHHDDAFRDVTKQFALMQEHGRDSNGLIHQGWDESKKERWADPQTGISPEAWGRGMGWYMAALVETLAWYPEHDPGRKQLISILNEDAAAVVRYQDATSGLWYEVMDKVNTAGNYREASASSLFVFALAEGVRSGYLPKKYLQNAERGYKGIVGHFIQAESGGDVILTGTVESTDLGGNPYHDGSYAFYAGQKTVNNDPKGVGVFLLASVAVERSSQ